MEGGFSLDENGLPFVVTYCIIGDASEKKSTGKSLGIRLSKTMFDFVKSGGSLNKVIESIILEKIISKTGYNRLFSRKFI